jgi:hypothetical protein
MQQQLRCKSWSWEFAFKDSQSTVKANERLKECRVHLEAGPFRHLAAFEKRRILRSAMHASSNH